LVGFSKNDTKVEFRFEKTPEEVELVDEDDSAVVLLLVIFLVVMASFLMCTGVIIELS